ncbi:MULTISPECIES: TetR/AcrR family transcriptional regulator [Pseudomonas]|uniref:TetR family transcriptional regulator n=1 Tax=Pseudomonas salomonii TaxID=191391 RepID=A0A7Y8KMD5_9PSED|nr:MULTISPECIES: TetR family transcriptional regulator [Pseudomonas]NWF07165.1 TetR family transcriptional regulator [Pseudomonas salomonii]
MTTEKRKTWQQDPNRREHILQVTLDCIELHGIACTTYRKISELSGVPLGSLTHYFPSMQELLLEAFQLLAQCVSTRFAGAIRIAKNKEDACHAIVDVIFERSTFGTRTIQLTCELYSFACRSPVMKSVMKDWMLEIRGSLELYFSPLSAVALDALIEGIILHRSVIPIAREDAHKMIVRLSDL